MNKSLPILRTTGPRKLVNLPYLVKPTSTQHAKWGNVVASTSANSLNQHAESSASPLELFFQHTI